MFLQRDTGKKRQHAEINPKLVWSNVKVEKREKDNKVYKNENGLWFRRMKEKATQFDITLGRYKQRFCNRNQKDFGHQLRCEADKVRVLMINGAQGMVCHRIGRKTAKIMDKLLSEDSVWVAMQKETRVMYLTLV